MKNAVTKLTLINLSFILLLSFSGSTEGIISELLYYAAFILPLAAGIFIIKQDPEHGRLKYLNFKPKAKDIGYGALMYAPTIAVILLIASLSALIMGAFGFSDNRVIEEPLYAAIILHALLPAILEELLFRFLPLELLSGYGRGPAIVISALSFSLVHCNLFQIPYALFAGIMFALIDMKAESALPSMVLHFINNLLSLISMMYPISALPIYISVGALAIISLVLIIIFRSEFKFIKTAFGDFRGEKMPYAILALVLVSLTVAITNLLPI